MSVLPGHEDLRSKAILGFDNMGFALVQCGTEVRQYRLSVGPGGALHAAPVADRVPQLPDQLQDANNSVRSRLRNYDQT